MIRATVSSQSCFCWLYRASPSLAAKNIINLISVLTMWCPCVESSLVLCGKSCFSVQNILNKTVSFCFILYSKIKLACYSGYLLVSYFCIPVLYDENDIFFLLLVLVSVVGLCRTSQFQLLWHQWLGHRLRLLWCWMFALEMKWDHSVVF